MIVQKVVVIFSLYLIQVDGGYTITTPLRWTVEQLSQLCVTLTEAAKDGDYIQSVFKTFVYPWEESKDVVPISAQKTFAITKGEQSVCYEYVLPRTSENHIGIEIKGRLLNKHFSHLHKISVTKDIENTFIQTDKYLYKPSQTVQFRILSLKGPLLQISHANYSEVWVENPSSSRIHQWTNITNDYGLMHLSFQLSDEPDQGQYKVSAQLESGEIYSTNFKVEDYVLPKYDVTITPPSYILGSAKEVIFDVCARYTFGQPVKGILILDVDNGGWDSHRKSLNISGCAKIVIPSEDLNINAVTYYGFRSINAKATVIEDGTSTKIMSDGINVGISRIVIKFKEVGLQYKKPGIPFVDEVLAQFPDNSPAGNEPMTICVGDITCKNMSTNANGILKYAIPPHVDETIKISAILHPEINDPVESDNTIMFKSITSRQFKSYYSPSNSSLTISPEQKNVKCDSSDSIDINLLVRFASSGQGNTIVHIQVISRGLIQYFNSSIQDFSKSNDIYIPEDMFIMTMEKTTVDHTRGSFSVPISLPKSVSPKVKILVWYEREDGEVVSDHRSLDITECLPNDVKLQWSQGLVRPGEDSNLTISSKPMSLCSLGVVDKSVELLSSSHSTLTTNKLLRLTEEYSVKGYDPTQVDDDIYCNKLATEERNREVVGNVTILHPLLSSEYGYDTTDIDAISMFNDAGVFVFSDLSVENRLCIARTMPQVLAFSYMTLDSPGANPDLPASLADSRFGSPRVYFPETWLWELILLKNGSLQMPLVLPDTITEWVGRAVCVHPTIGVGLSNIASVTTFKDFFIDLTLPASTKRAEIFPVKISIFNYLKEQLPVRMSLINGPDYDILGENKEELGNGVRSACVEPEGKVVFSIRIKPNIVGQMNITVNAMIDSNSVQCGGTNVEERTDVVVKSVKVDYEGFPKEKTWNNYVCLHEKTENVTDVWKMVAPTGIVEDSARGWLSAVSDLMGPTVENLGHLVKMPFGCGEQNMLNFAPNIFVLQYLDAANETTDEIAEKSMRFMETGYQRELNYRHDDGSFSAFGPSDDSGSTWLTAFVLKSFVKAQQFINVDSSDIAMSAEWLKKIQMENGCFELVGKVLHKGMKGGIQNDGSPSLLSAYVLLSLLEAGEDPNSATVREAQFCLKADKTSDPYALAVRLYAFTLANAPEARQTAKDLISLATHGESTVSWNMDNDAKKSKSIALETASYVTLGLLNLDSAEYKNLIYGIVRWINQQRNAQGGFISTQDTILALQALALYETILPATQPDATVVFVSDNHDESFTVNNSNKLLLQKTKLPSIPANVTINVFGSGCVLLQGVLRYNVLEGDANKAFNLSVSTKTPHDPSCKTKEITVCASYLLPDLTSNMAIIEVNLVSGYIPNKQDLKDIVGFGYGLFKRYEVDGNTVTLYLDEITAESLCATFKIIREVVVENVKPGTAKVYDYYKPEYAVSQNYVLPANSECSLTKSELVDEREIGIDDNLARLAPLPEMIA